MNTPQRIGAGRPKSEVKRQRILAAAGRCFIAHGFIGTSMELVAKQAEVSKQTVYSHFANKENLYCEVIRHKCTEYQLDHNHVTFCDTPLEAQLTRIGQRTLKLLLDPDCIAMYKMLIGEIASNAAVSELFYTAGIRYSSDLLASYLAQQQQYPISESSARELATLFFNAIRGEYHMKSLLNVQQHIVAEELHAHVDRTVSRILWCLQCESQATANSR